jgi:hypothetical protein
MILLIFLVQESPYWQITTSSLDDIEGIIDARSIRLVDGNTGTQIV